MVRTTIWQQQNTLHDVLKQVHVQKHTCLSTDHNDLIMRDCFQKVRPGLAGREALSLLLHDSAGW